MDTKDTGRFKALKADEFGLHFSRQDEPTCPHCGIPLDIEEAGAWHLYDPHEGTHDVTCPNCGEDYEVSVCVSYSFSTNEQSAMDDEAIAQATGG
jgi:predicted RNA-binding Zn-ribbon protein involved in translation (DUF1610 family)